MIEKDFAHEIPRRFESAPGPPDELHARLATAIAETPAPQWPLRHRLALVACALPCAVAITLLGRHALFGRPLLRGDLPSLPDEQLVLELALLGLLTIGTTAVAVRPGPAGFGSAARLLGATSLVIAPAFLVISLFFPLESANHEDILASARLHPFGLPCMVLAAIIGTVALAALSWALRHAVPVSARLRGAAVGAASGAWAGLALVIHCPASAPLHVLASHVAPIAVFTALGVLVVPAFLRP
ncbi:NrsF family protein [Sorangium sp. So ce124]|uniref:NrsF family protein n=1 Tax=Sorangium sp. So ce124 TaxID=3133280 RepID=UPI003F62555E